MIASSALGSKVVLTDGDEPDPDDSTGGFSAARSGGWFSGASASRACAICWSKSFCVEAKTAS
jgi:hypothetical protein